MTPSEGPEDDLCHASIEVKAALQQVFIKKSGVCTYLGLVQFLLKKSGAKLFRRVLWVLEIGNVGVKWSM